MRDMFCCWAWISTREREKLREEKEKREKELQWATPRVRMESNEGSSSRIINNVQSGVGARL